MLAGLEVAVAALLASLLAASQGSAESQVSLHCSPQILHPGDTLRLRMPVPHPAELAVFHPDGTPFFLVYEPSVGARDQPLYSKDEFREVALVLLDVDVAVGTPWARGRRPSERIFTAGGTYKFILTEILETEDVPTAECTVDYQPRTVTDRLSNEALQQTRSALARVAAALAAERRCSADCDGD